MVYPSNIFYYDATRRTKSCHLHTCKLSSIMLLSAIRSQR